MAEKDITISVDSTEVDEALKKVRKLHKHLKKAKKLATEIQDINAVLTLPDTQHTFGASINGHVVYESKNGFCEQCQKPGVNPFSV